jgi:hypothetical protein
MYPVWLITWSAYAKDRIIRWAETAGCYSVDVLWRNLYIWWCFKFAKQSKPPQGSMGLLDAGYICAMQLRLMMQFEVMSGPGRRDACLELQVPTN